jgi:DNA replication protein DnaC
MDNNKLKQCLKDLKLYTVLDYHDDYLIKADKEGWNYKRFLYELLNIERESRNDRLVQKLLRDSKLPISKTLDKLERKRLPRIVNSHIDSLIDGSFLDRNENILIFGNPGSGKTHTVCAIGYELIIRKRKVLFKNCEMLVQELLVAKRDLKLPALLKKLGKYEGLIIDDIGYVQQNREEMEVLFTLLADRYEKASTMITSNLAFSKWEKIFKDPMTTAAAIDRLVHHSIILELNISSYRLEQAKKKELKNEKEDNL